MTADELRTAYDMFKQIQFDSKTDEQRYNSHFYEHMRIETEHQLKFMSWVKQTYPEVWEGWRSLQDIANG